MILENALEPWRLICDPRSYGDSGAHQNFEETVVSFFQNVDLAPCIVLKKQPKKAKNDVFKFQHLWEKSNLAAIRPPLNFWLQNTSKYMKTACLIFLGQKRNLEEFLSEILIFQPRFKGGRGRIG